MTYLKKLRLALRAVRELGVAQLANYAGYQIGIRSGFTERASRIALKRALQGNRAVRFQSLFNPPSAQLLLAAIGDEIQGLVAEAEDICEGKVRIFGSQVVELDAGQGKSDLWFTRLERSLAHSERTDLDLKFVWEPARFGWVYPLARAYCVQPDERYAQRFWETVEAFLDNHPPYCGFQWLSAQEVALRLIAWVFGYQVFQNASASTEARKQRLIEALAVHAARIPCTIQYALAQNNNHLLSEAVGLMTAGTVLRAHPLAEGWWNQGWRWFILGIQRQIADDGTYVQQSTNYHRLMLQLALWARLVALRMGVALPAEVTCRLSAASQWLADCCELSNGRVPNLGPNDGAYIQPLSQSPFEDFRPVLQAAYRAFVGEAAFGSGAWDEMSLWYGVWSGESPAGEAAAPKGVLRERERLSIRENAWVVLRSPDQTTWATLRCPRFFSRPTHADQLHVDLWWAGMNLACDAGTYRYTASPPWDNRLAEAFYHNTVTIDGRNPMTRAGRFLWLDWAKTDILVGRFDDGKNDLTIGGEHNGYRSIGVRVQRWVTLRENRIWVIKDRIEAPKQKKWQSKHFIRLHWLIHPAEWQVAAEEKGWRLLLRLNSQEIRLGLRASPRFKLCIVEAGNIVFGEGRDAGTYGYCSPTYNLLLPALSVILEGEEWLPTTLETVWELPAKSLKSG